MKLHSRGLLLSLCFAILSFYEIGAVEGAGTQDIYTVQVMAVKDKAAAQVFADSLEAKGYDAHVLMAADDETGLPYKVRIGRFEDKQDAQRFAVDYEKRESAACYVTRDMRESGKAPLAPAAPLVDLPEYGQVDPASEAAYQGFYESIKPSGPLFGSAYVLVEPRFIYRLQYEDNVDWDSSDKVSDWSNVYKPAVDITALLNSQLSVKTSVALDIHEYIDEKDFNYVDQNYAVSLGYLASERTEFSLGGGYEVNANTYRFYEQDISLDDYYTREKNKTKSFNAGFSHNLSRNSTIGVTSFISNYDSATTDDSDFFGAVVNYARGLSHQTDLLIVGNYFQYEFDGNNKVYNIDDVDDLYYSKFSFYDYTLKNYSLSVGLGHTFKQDCSLRGLFGYRYTSVDNDVTVPGVFENSDSGNGDGWVAELDFAWRFNDYAFEVGAYRDITISQYGDSFESTVLKLRQFYDFTRRLALVSTVQYAKAKTDGDEFSLNNRDTETYTIQTSLSYKVKRWLTTRLAHSYRYVDDSNTRRSSVHANLVYIEFIFTPTRPLVIR